MAPRDVEAANGFSFPSAIDTHPWPLGAGSFAPRYLALEPADFAAYCDDDRQITAATIRVHPLIGVEAEAAVDAELIPWPASKREHAAGTVLFELGDPAVNDVHLVLTGRAKLIEVRRGAGTRREIGQCRSGQLVGMPQLLRAYHASVGAADAWPDDLTIEVVAMDGMLTQRGDVAAWIAVMKRLPDFRRFVENQVAVRFSRRQEVLRRFAENALLRMLAPADAEYVMGLAALREAPDATPVPCAYLAAGAPGRRVALVLDGEATAILPADATTGPRYAATFGPGQLFGHEAIVMPGEEAAGDYAPLVPIVEPARRTEIRVSPGAELLELSWYGFRWAMDDKKSVWDRVVRILTSRASGLVDPLPSVINVTGAKSGLGTTTLTYLTAMVLAWQTEPTGVRVVDLQGEDNFAGIWSKLGFQATPRYVELQPRSRQERAQGRKTRLDYVELTPPSGAAPSPLFGIDVRWPATPTDAETLIEILKGEPGVRTILVCGDMTDAVRALGRAIDASADTVLRVTDDADDAYDTAHRRADDPPNLTWVYRLTGDYVQREIQRSRREPLVARIERLNTGGVRVDALLSPVVGQPLQKGRDSERPLLHRAVRVPDAPEASLFQQGKLGEILAMDLADAPLKRACFRLARVVQQRTVGLALGGGGAWGFAHVALLKNLEATGVPVDYISGTSFGSVVGGLYAGGGMAALDRLLDQSCAKSEGTWEVLRAFVTGPLNWALPAAAIDGVFLEWFVDAQLAGPDALTRPVCLGTTEIPFFPVGTNLDTHEELTGFPASVGHGVRMSGAMPPFFGAVLRQGEPIVDGALIANVPSRVARQAGAHFVIAANVVAAPTPDAHTGPRGLVRRLLGRVENLLVGLFVLVWKAGQDQGALSADESLDFQPKEASFLSMWKGQAIVDAMRTAHFSGKDEHRLLDAWRRFVWRPRPT